MRRWAALAVTLAAAILALHWERARPLRAALAEVAAMDVAELGLAYAASPYHREPEFLAAVASNPRASSGLLAEMVRHEDRGLRRLIARHPGAGAAALERLAQSPDGPALLEDILAHRNAAPALLARYFDSAEPSAQRGLARNPGTPQRVLMALAGSPDAGVRARLAANDATPWEALAALAADPDEAVAAAAAAALERRRGRATSASP